MDNLEQLLPKYDINRIEGCLGGVKIYYNKLDDIDGYTYCYMYEHIDIIKFIHDNFDYIVEMLLANGFLQNKSKLCEYVRETDNLHICIKYHVIEIYNKDNPISLYNTATIFDDLRKNIGIDISYKPIRLHDRSTWTQ